jgi:hypothetical protein
MLCRKSDSKVLVCSGSIANPPYVVGFKTYRQRQVTLPAVCSGRLFRKIMDPLNIIGGTAMLHLGIRYWGR